MPPHTSKLQFTSMSLQSHVIYVSKTSELALDYCCMSLNVKFVPNKADSNRMRKSCKLQIVDALQTYSTREHRQSIQSPQFQGEIRVNNFIADQM